MKKVFLGGTCNNSTWRDELIPFLKIEFFNPVVPDWTEECYQEELRQRETCDYCLYVITPKMTGFYSIAEVVEDSIKRPEKTIFVALTIDGDNTFNLAQIKSLHAVSKMIIANGGKFFANLYDLEVFLNCQNNA